jgi:hypothetical protein
MSPGVRYYSNVVANTLSGLQTTVSSDGIMDEQLMFFYNLEIKKIK